MVKNLMHNHFKLSEWSGAIGDIGTTLPIAFALIVFNGFPAERIFFLWGLVYAITGWYYKVPVSVQPLKAMAVIAITMGYSVAQLSTTSFFYGILLVVLSISGIIRGLEKWFSTALVRGIQLGLGLMLTQKAVLLAVENGVFFGQTVEPAPIINIIIFATIILILWYVQFHKKLPVILAIIPAGIVVSWFFKVSFDFTQFKGTPVAVTAPDWTFFMNCLPYLILPQLSLTLGNAVFAASDACHALWKERAQRVNPTRLGLSINDPDSAIGSQV